MGTGGMELSDRVISTVAEVLETDPMDLPPLQDTIEAAALDYLFQREGQQPGAYTVFPYCELWVVVHSTGTIDVFDDYRATSADEQLPDDVPELTTDERIVVFHFEDQRYTFYEDEIDTLHEIISDADSGDEAWDEVIEYAEEHTE